MTRPLVLLAEDLHTEARDWLAERCEVVDCPTLAGEDGGTSRAGTPSPKGRGSDAEPSPKGKGGGADELLGRAEGLVVRTYTRVDDALLDRMPRLRVVGRAGAGVDNINLDACRRRGVAVVHTPQANTQAVVEYVWTLILDALRPRAEVHNTLSIEQWRALRDRCTAGRQLSDLTLGIYGFGRIGGRAASVGAAFGMRAIYHDLREIPAAQRFGAEPVTRETLLAEADILSVHVDGREANRNLIGAEAMARMKPDVVMVNTSRGLVIDAAALARFLSDNPRALALLDVHEPEPFGSDDPLLGLPNARLFPHLGAATATAHQNMSWIVEDVWRVLAGEAPRFAATVQSGS